MLAFRNDSAFEYSPLSDETADSQEAPWEPLYSFLDCHDPAIKLRVPTRSTRPVLWSTLSR